MGILAHQKNLANERKVVEPRKTFKAVKGDIVDRLFQNYLKERGIDLPITRLGGGFYMFGTKKIYAKIMNGKLLVRVGGGFMGIDEFIHTHVETEQQKLQRYSTAEIAEMHTPTDILKDNQMMRASTMMQAKSPRATLLGKNMIK